MFLLACSSHLETFPKKGFETRSLEISVFCNLYNFSNSWFAAALYIRSWRRKTLVSTSDHRMSFQLFMFDMLSLTFLSYKAIYIFRTTSAYPGHYSFLLGNACQFMLGICFLVHPSHFARLVALPTQRLERWWVTSFLVSTPAYLGPDSVPIALMLWIQLVNLHPISAIAQHTLRYFIPPVLLADNHISSW